jgi:hypothetical protein
VTHNPALRKLGFAPHDRVVIVHADDVGMCGATIEAFLELAADGLLSAGSVRWRLAAGGALTSTWACT